jgi:hypothetical protein
MSGIPTHDPSVRAVEGGSCLKPSGYCDRLTKGMPTCLSLARIIEGGMGLMFIEHSPLEIGVLPEEFSDNDETGFYNRR